ncbi:hypothetical protein DSCA_23060 [Desulfosarcina alkanivorans]|uniref:Peptidase S8/S53 domain-containing protein n=1 Tax=Desulfosarcina alkanivorans TaxID=571177 RepID=A0A5K7YGY0_9BACT|nr:hypothetical protein [Desulfosarcina alkanivorans]BBO68376.1 hypothetical protein DSCA_23060 [Desulfosarcina alkanivorans]
MPGPQKASWKLRFIVLAATVLLWLAAPLQAASYRDDIGYTGLEDERGTDIPDGTGVGITQVEAEVPVVVDEETGETAGTWTPDRENDEFAGKTISFKSSSDTTAASGHATSVGRQFYGNSSSMAPAIVDIDAYETNDWLTSGFLACGLSLYGNPVQPHYEWYVQLSSPSRVANHSWVGTTDDDTADSELLKRLDFVVDTDEFIQITAVNNGSTQKSLLSGAFNAITVGRTDACHPIGTIAIDSLYTPGRTCPLLVAPMSTTSSASPIVASAAALLVQTGQDAALSTDPSEQSTQNRDGDAITNAERSEVIKAALLAGADRVTRNTWSADQIADYRQDGDNGLDRRFGAGQVNITNSHHIIAAGEQNSDEDDPAGHGQIGTEGFDVDPAFGGSGGSNATASYFFTADQDRSMLYASLVWNLHIDGGVFYHYDDTATLYDFDLTLYDVTDADHPTEVAASASSVDNTENLWVPLTSGRTYRLLVHLGPEQADCRWDYALAWRIATPPDTDGDTLPDDWEVYHGMDHTSIDTDADGMADGWEEGYSLDPLTDDGSLDTDDDGLDNLDEFTLGTAPDDPDTDGDGYTDGMEVAAGTDPLDAEDFPQISAVPAVAGNGLLAAMAALMVAGSVTICNRKK